MVSIQSIKGGGGSGAVTNKGKVALFLIAGLFALTFSLISFSSAKAASTCVFSDSGSIRTLLDDCTTDETINIPDGMTLDGNGNTITAVNPAVGPFKGAIVQNAGATAHVTNLDVTTDGLTGSAGGDDRLRGIMFDGASGTITHSTILNINRGASGSQEGNAVEVRNGPFDGAHPNTQIVIISHNIIDDYQKTGIVANGDVDVSIQHNQIGDSATQENLAANSVQLGFGATGQVTKNNIAGNQWKGTTNWGATAVLVYLANDVNVSNNNIRGNSDIGLYLFGDDSIVDNNRVFDEGADHPNSGSDFGIGNWGSDNSVTKNKVKGFDNPYSGVVGGRNITVPGSQKGNPSF